MSVVDDNCVVHPGMTAAFCSACVEEAETERDEHCARAEKAEARVAELESAITRGLGMLEGKGIVLPVDKYAQLLDLALREIRSAYHGKGTRMNRVETATRAASKEEVSLWKRGQVYGCARAAAEARIQGLDAFADQLERMMRAPDDAPYPHAALTIDATPGEMATSTLTPNQAEQTRSIAAKLRECTAKRTAWYERVKSTMTCWCGVHLNDPIPEWHRTHIECADAHELPMVTGSNGS